MVATSRNADELAAPLDLLLTSSAVGVAERMMPNVAWSRFALNLAKQPRTVASRAVGLGRDLISIAEGRSDLAPGKGNAWYRDLGQGMGATLNVSAALDAYTLTDRATWANFKNRQNLEILAEGDVALLNPYGSILVSPAKWPHVKHTEARTWHEWLTSKPGLDAITSYRVNGEQLFFAPPRRDALAMRERAP